ncbi:helix-turn-helix transcriptional regulator [Roseobacter sinensis]|uniref:AraC family transcriptional regulator n=1 Tax=Roseobacter sinensis TaxID=2931391 RepID=A0ABT3BLN3_9RHOB|nr:AraC family transcriptional regulator [Roseobacter sp. WL0113]MCV3274269.1 AraC family transcriptional regulator [Roseobacter sp. WL0113]
MARIWQKQYSDFASFYKENYGSTLVGVYPTAIDGINIVETDQSPGDWSAASLPELNITRIVGGDGMATADLGAGRFRSNLACRGGVLVPPNSATDIYVECFHRLQFIAIPFDYLETLTNGQNVPRDGDFGRIHCQHLTEPFLFNIFDEMVREARAGNPRGRMFVEGAIMTMVSTLNTMAQRPVEQTNGGLSPFILKRVTDFITDHLADQITLTQLSDIAGLSVFHFCRAFKKSTGLAPYKFQTARRIEKAKLLLDTTDFTITDIAPMVGYETPQAFARMFRQMVGQTPTVYRQSLCDR